MAPAGLPAAEADGYRDDRQSSFDTLDVAIAP
jgi:hypothetical protein